MRALAVLAALALAAAAPPGSQGAPAIEEDGGIDPPSIILQPKAPAGVKEDSQVSLRVVATGADDYTWSKDGEQLLDERGHISGATSFNLRIYGAALADAGEYRCFVSNAAGVTASMATELVVVPREAPGAAPAQDAAAGEQEFDGLPTIVLQPRAPPAPSGGGQASLRVVADGVDSYQWLKDGVPLGDAPGRVSGARSFNLRIRSVQLGDVGNYTCELRNRHGTVTTHSAFLGMKDADIQIASQPPSQKVVVGSPVALSVAAAPVDHYRWHRDGQPLADGGGLRGARGPTLTLAAASFDDAGLYYCEMRNAMHEARSRVAQLSVTPDPRPPEITAHPNSYSVRQGSSMTLSVQTERATTLQWLKGGAPLADDARVTGSGGRVLVVRDVGAQDAGTYRCEARNAFGAAQSLTALVKVQGVGRHAGKRLCPPEEPLLRSDKVGCQQQKVVVHNSAQRPVVGFHIDPDGKSAQYFDMGAGSVNINTCVGHAWRVATPTGHVLLQWVVRDGSRTNVDDCLRPAKPRASHQTPFTLGTYFAGGSLDVHGGQLFGIRQPSANGGQQIFDVNRQLREALRSQQLNVDVQRSVTCPVCEGRGGAKHQVEQCAYCGGSGGVEVLHELGGVVQQVQNVCPVCDGHGHVHKPGHVCSRCRGARVVPDHFKAKLDIPVGAPDMHTITFPGQGTQAPFKTPMDIAFRVRYQPHEAFSVEDGVNLRTVVNVTLADALAGFNVTVPRLEGAPLDIERREPTPFNYEMPIRGEGLPIMGAPGGERGDLIVEFNVVMPETVYDEEYRGAFPTW